MKYRLILHHRESKSFEYDCTFFHEVLVAYDILQQMCCYDPLFYDLKLYKRKDVLHDETIYEEWVSANSELIQEYLKSKTVRL